ncbi:clotting factor B-like [Ornithodoros turicata]|uniref:clotting factor B-like n=1 Tax=Ornithodoros turicata TaxID=34597 RepID=UPI003138D81E
MNVATCVICLLLATAVIAQDCGSKGPRSKTGGEWPWLASIVEFSSGRTPSFLCAGILISRSHVLTASHCFDGKPLSPRRYAVLLGGASSDTGAEHNIFFITRHPSYVRGKAYGDIAVLTLREDVPESTSFICLPKAGQAYEYKPSFVSEFLPKKLGASDPFAPRSSRVLIGANNDCQSHYNGKGVTEIDQGITDSILCSDLRGKQGECDRLTASPLMVPDTSVRWSVVGIAAHRPSCLDQTNPGIYTRVTYYLPWIQDVMNS